MEFNKTIYTLRNDTACLTFFTKKKKRQVFFYIIMSKSPYSSFPTQMAYPSDKLAMDFFSQTTLVFPSASLTFHDTWFKQNANRSHPAFVPCHQSHRHAVPCEPVRWQLQSLSNLRKIL
jgi:hypothetical protein